MGKYYLFFSDEKTFLNLCFETFFIILDLSVIIFMLLLLLFLVLLLRKKLVIVIQFVRPFFSKIKLIVLETIPFDFLRHIMLSYE